jgi:hypothetical protein
MERAVAIRKLGKLIGKGFGYRIDNKAPSSGERIAAKAELVTERAKRDDLDKKCNERRIAILMADAEYQKLRTEYMAARKQTDILSGMTYRKKITVGATNGMFFVVMAVGDSWEEVISKVETKKLPV